MQAEVAARNILKLIERQEGRTQGDEPLESYIVTPPSIKVSLGLVRLIASCVSYPSLIPLILSSTKPSLSRRVLFTICRTNPSTGTRVRCGGCSGIPTRTRLSCKSEALLLDRTACHLFLTQCSCIIKPYMHPTNCSEPVYHTRRAAVQSRL